MTSLEKIIHKTTAIIIITIIEEIIERISHKNKTYDEKIFYNHHYINFNKE